MIHVTRFDGFDKLARRGGLRKLDEAFTQLALRPSIEDSGDIRLDVAELDKAYTVDAELPGARKEDIEVRIAGKRIDIDAEIRRMDTSGDGGTLLRNERRLGRRSRSFSLPQDVDEARAQAEFKDGVLRLTLPKKSDGEIKIVAVK